ncbi:MAG: DNA polymerase IV [Candidatus Nanopelagicales bacterium]|nr:DNA polymerase IV [Candidatus Nanopelagicales bacterium]MDP4714552.1 DNA polymerase IV [Candidatus Nanopelagicales bacterium]MDP4906075.1 DNA polymerase IV [Candidatus Nanopelagicales bacterium]MDP4974515.1 DNA polymerase IV [Candidatus Nanopelagicales bacterium]
MSRSQIRRVAHQRDLGSDDGGCTILHVDMDAFYASVELVTRPELRGKPVIVGGGQRGVVLSGTYEARALGIHSAMPMSRARRIAPQAIVIEPHHERYAEVSAGIMAIFSSVTPIVEPLSLDEAFLNVSGALRRLGSATAIAELIRARVYDEQRITCSVGVASTKFVAKLASTQAKPDGLLVVPIDKVTAFLHPLPVGALWGVGERTEERLVSLGLRTVGDLAHTPVETLTRALGQASGDRLHDLAWGRDERGVVPDAVEKSIGNEETFARDIDDPEMIHREILRLAQKVAARVRRQGHLGRTVVLKVRFADFTTITRSRTLETPTDVGQVIYTTAVELYAALRLQRARIRLVGVRLEGLLDAATRVEQLIFDDSAADPADRRAAEVAADRLRERFGRDVVRPARLWDPQP